MQETNFWNDTKKAASIIQTSNKLKENLQELKKLQDLIEELELAISLEDESLNEEIENLILKIDKDLEHFEINQLLNGEYDNCNAIMELHPGAGGTESQDWALMLYRMYRRFCEQQKVCF